MIEYQNLNRSKSKKVGFEPPFKNIVIHAAKNLSSSSEITETQISVDFSNEISPTENSVENIEFDEVEKPKTSVEILIEKIPKSIEKQ